jgi:phosphatidylserine decarboxylase
MVIYLSPGDYHRFHAPAIHTAQYRRHIVGYLAPVKPSYVAKHKDVFKHNERVNIFGDWYGTDKNFFFVSYVGALNVGSIVLDFDSNVETNKTFNKDPYMYDKSYNGVQKGPLSNYELGVEQGTEGIRFSKGEMTGRFEMGSTIVLIWESPKETCNHVIAGQKL